MDVGNRPPEVKLEWGEELLCFAYILTIAGIHPNPAENETVNKNRSHRRGVRATRRTQEGEVTEEEPGGARAQRLQVWGGGQARACPPEPSGVGFLLKSARRIRRWS